MAAADDLAALIEERQRRTGQLTGASKSVLAAPEETTTLEEVKRAVTSLLKGSTKGVIDLVGGWGKLYDVIKKNPTPSALSGQGIINAIAKAGGPDLLKIEGYKGMYDIGQAGGPSAVMSLMAPGSGLFNLSTPMRTAAAEFTTAGGLGMLAQQVAPESVGAQIAMQSLPYLVKGGVTGLQAKSQQKKIDEYRSLLPTKDANTFSEFMLRGQSSSDPFVAADIARLSSSPKYLELINALNEGASAKAVAGMSPKAAPLSAEQAKVGIIQSIQNKLEGMRDSKADSLFNQAKGYGEARQLVLPTSTLKNIDSLISRYGAQVTPNAERAVDVLKKMRERLAAPFETAEIYGSSGSFRPVSPDAFKLTVEQVQGLLSEFGKKASAGDNLIKDLSISDERIISSAIFGGMKNDLSLAAKNATGYDQTALNLLNTARDKVSKSSTAYNEAIAQGLPAFLQNKSLSEISPEQLFSTYTSLTPAQRATMRSWVGNTDQAALSVLDKQVFDNFVSSAKMPNATGVETVDLATLAKNWRGLDSVSKDALVTALGTNSSEFGKRMKDAEVMTRKMRTSAVGVDAIISPSTARETSAVLGASSGYGASKIAQISMDLVNSFTKNGLTEDQLIKALLTPEGASFLKNAALSPRSASVLDDLTKMQDANPVLRWTAGTVARVGPRAGITEQPTVQTEQEAQQGQDDLSMLLQEQASRQSQPQQ